MAHETSVTAASQAELETVLGRRWYSRWLERNAFTADEPPTDEEQAAGVQELLDVFVAEGGTKGGGAFNAYCSCGWAANNPVPAEEHAQAAADEHRIAIYGEV